MFPFFLVVSVLWLAARTFKAARSLQRDEPYTFAMWDGGLLRQGKTLTRRGAQMHVFLDPLLALSCIGMATRVLPIGVSPFVVVLALGIIVADFALSAR